MNRYGSLCIKAYLKYQKRIADSTLSSLERAHDTANDTHNMRKISEPKFVLTMISGGESHQKRLW